MNARLDENKFASIMRSRTLLPPLPLKFDAAGHAESMDHYLARIANACGCRPGQLALIVSKSTRLEKFNHSFIERLEELTRQSNLIRATFLSVCGIVRGLRMRPSGFRRWCPACYDNWSQGCFEPLYWTVTQLQTCPLHGVRLIDRCVECGSRQPAGVPLAARLRCRGCGASLAGDGEFEGSDCRWDNTILDLCHFAANSRLPVDSSQVSGRLLTLGKLGGARFYNALEMKLTPMSLVRACLLLGVTPTELFAKEIAPFELPLLHFEESIDDTRCSGKTAAKLRWTARVVEDLYHRRKCLLPLSAVCRATGVLVNSLKKFQRVAFEKYASRHPEQIGIHRPRVLGKVADRALELWMSSPAGPVSRSQINSVTRKIVKPQFSTVRMVRSIVIAALRTYLIMQATKEKVPRPRLNRPVRSRPRKKSDDGQASGVAQLKLI